VRMARETALSNRSSALAQAANGDTELSAHAIYNLTMQGDEDARRIFRSVGRSLGIALSSLVNALNLPIYVIGGGVSGAWDAFSPTMFEELRKRSIVYAANTLCSNSAENRIHSTGETIIARAMLGSDAGLYGAARLPMIADGIAEVRS